MCNVPDCILFACFDIGKNDVCIAITPYFYNSPKWLYLFCLYSVFIIIRKRDCMVFLNAGINQNHNQKNCDHT